MSKAVKTIYILLGILTALIIIQWWIGYKIKNTVKNQIYQQSQGAIQAEIRNVRVRLIGRTVFFRDIRISTDSTRKIPADFPLKYVDAHIREFVLKGFQLRRKDSTTTIRARKLSLNAPYIRLKESTSTKTDSARRHQNSALHLQLKDSDIRLNDVQYTQFQQQDSSHYALQDFHCRLVNCQLNSPITFQSSASCEDIQLSFRSFQNYFAGHSQLLVIDTLSLLGKEKRFSVGSIQLLPQYSKADFVIKNPRHSDWSKIKTGEINCYGFDILHYIQKQQLHIDSIAIKSAQISTYKNRQIEQPQHVKKLFYESVQQFPIPLSIRRTHMENINVEYQELAKNGPYPGTITFKNLEGTLYDLTNIIHKSPSHFTLKATGELMGKGILTATFQFPVNSVNKDFEIKGELSRMEIAALNPMIEPLTQIKVTSGKVNKLTFKINGNSQKAKVYMTFLYDDLKVRLLKEKDGKWKERSFLTTLVNGIILIENNPNQKGLRSVEGSAERNFHRSQFNYLWRILLSGLKKTIGI